MPPFELLLPFLVATVGFAVLPGAGMVYMSVQTIAHGRRAGLVSAAGFHLAGLVHIGAAACGVALLLQAQPAFFTALKLAGAGYLAWMGLRLMRGDRQRAHATPSPPIGRAFRDSLTVELLNPKTALFFLAFLPQFTAQHAALPVWAQLMILGAVANIVFSTTDAACILLAERLSARAATSRRLARAGRRIGGGLFVAMGVYMAWESRAGGG